MTHYFPTMTAIRDKWAWRPVCAIAGSGAALLLALNARYGYLNDELYFRILGERPNWGYADQGPLTPLLARAAGAVFGDTVWALRVPGTLWYFGLVLVVSLLAREFGGGRAAQVLAAVGAAGGGYPLLLGHVMLTTSLDLPLTLVVLLAVVRAVRGDGRWWLVAGAVAGLATYNKLMIALLAIGLAAGLLAAGPHRVLRDRWFWLGLLVAGLLAAPNLIYQAVNGWPEVTMARALGRNEVADNRATFLPYHLGLLGPLLAPICVAGVVRLWRDRPMRLFAVAYLVELLVALVSGGHVYYPVAFLVLAFAAGCPATVRWARTRWRGVVLVVLVAVNVLFNALLMLPVLPADAVRQSPVAAMHKALRKQLGWPEFTAQVAAVVRGLPVTDRASAVLLATDYGEAGALMRFGPDHGLPAVYSAHNELYNWGPPPASATTAVVVGSPADELREHFADCEQAATVDTGLKPGESEHGAPIVVCRDPRGGWPAVWPRLRHFG